MNAVLERIEAVGPKKILACDGGGILGMMSVEILAKIEADLRIATNKPGLVLADWFDFVCGTSTGAIIATCISLGMSTAQLRKFYLDSGPMMFEKSWLTKRLRYAYTDEPLARMLRQQINEAVQRAPDDTPATLGDDGLRTVLMMVMRNHTTDSPWPVSNNPQARYNDRNRPDCNLNLPLWKLVRASTAAPTFFPPEVVVFGANTAKEYSFVFVDGGVTTYNNPAFLAFQMATAKAYRMNWETGTDKMLIVSVGTGTAPRSRPGLSPDDLWLLDHAKSMPSALMNAASAGWDMACRTIGECRFGGHIDNEFGNGMEAAQSTIPKQFAYVRYDPDVTAKGLADLGLGDSIKPENVQLMDSVAHIGDIQRVGKAFAERHVSPLHFNNF